MKNYIRTYRRLQTQSVKGECDLVVTAGEVEHQLIWKKIKKESSKNLHESTHKRHQNQKERTR